MRTTLFILAVLLAFQAVTPPAYGQFYLRRNDAKTEKTQNEKKEKKGVFSFFNRIKTDKSEEEDKYSGMTKELAMKESGLSEKDINKISENNIYSGIATPAYEQPQPVAYKPKRRKCSPSEINALRTFDAYYKSQATARRPNSSNSKKVEAFLLSPGGTAKATQLSIECRHHLQ